MDLLVEHLHVVADERRRAGDHLMNETAKRVDVGARVDGVTGDLLGGHIRRRADDHAAAGQRLALGGASELGQAKVDELGGLAVIDVGGDDDVRRLEIAMDHARRVRRLEAATEPDGEAKRALDGQPSLRAQELSQRLAAHILHHQERRIADHEVEEARYVRMDHGGNRLRLALEAAAEITVGEQRRLEQLDGDLEADCPVLGQVDIAHGAGAQPLRQTVTLTDDGAGADQLAPEQAREILRERVDAGQPFGRRQSSRVGLVDGRAEQIGICLLGHTGGALLSHESGDFTATFCRIGPMSPRANRKRAAGATLGE